MWKNIKGDNVEIFSKLTSGYAFVRFFERVYANRFSCIDGLGGLLGCLSFGGPKCVG